MQKQMTHLQLSNGSYHGEVTGPEPIRHGMGQMNFNDGSYYEGQWMNDKRNGHGIFYFSSGNVYQGYFVNNKKEGYGEFYYAKSQEYYKGYWMNDKKHGQGEYFFKNGDKFEGFFVQDIKHGPGVKISKSFRYEGVWENNKKNGSFEFLNLKTGKIGIIYYKNNKKVGIQPSRMMNPGNINTGGYGLRAGEQMDLTMNNFSNYTHSYQSPSCQRQSSNKQSLSDIQEKTADFPGEVGRQDRPDMHHDNMENVIQNNLPRQMVSQNMPPNIVTEQNSYGDINKGFSEPRDEFALVRNSNVGSLEVDVKKNKSKVSTEDTKEQIQIPHNSMNKNINNIPQIKETSSFKSYDSRTIKSTSQGTFNSSAKTNMKAFYDYKEFKEGLSTGKMNLKLMKEEELSKGQMPNMKMNEIPNDRGINIESLSMEKHEMTPKEIYQNQIPSSFHMNNFVQDQYGQFGLPQNFQNNQIRGAPMYRGYMPQVDSKLIPHKLAQIEEGPELRFGNKEMGIKSFMGNFNPYEISPNLRNQKNDPLNEHSNFQG